MTRQAHVPHSPSLLEHRPRDAKKMPALDHEQQARFAGDLKPHSLYRHAPGLLEKIGVVRCQPGVQPAFEIVDNGEQFCEVVVGYGVVSLVGGQIAFAAEGIDLHEQIRVDCERQRQCLQRDRVVAELIRSRSVAGGSQGDGGDPQQRIVGSDESPFATKPRDARVRHASLEPALELLDFVSLRCVAMQLPDLDQVVQAHAHLQSGTTSVRPVLAG